ncbi:hypothetical protein [Endozoicomonas acroporae]|uniref:hypothetical protein n=1 Tax=Endozoicomonas acroporae TaxID=1701104 RepID=UPI003D7A1B71
MHNYISLIHENIKSRLLLCSEVHFAEMSVKPGVWEYTLTPRSLSENSARLGDPVAMMAEN